MPQRKERLLLERFKQYSPPPRHPSQQRPPPGSPAVESWFDLMLVCHFIIGQGYDAFYSALLDPAKTIAARGSDQVAAYALPRSTLWRPSRKCYCSTSVMVPPSR